MKVTNILLTLPLFLATACGDDVITDSETTGDDSLTTSSAASSSTSSGSSSSSTSTSTSDGETGSTSTQTSSTSSSTEMGTSSSTGVDAICGDGLVQAGEECDDNNSKPEDGCDESCQWESRTIFVTQKTFNGALGGINGADMKCQEAAEKAGLTDNGEVYLAVISTIDMWASYEDRFGDEFPGVYKRTDGEIVAFDLFGEHYFIIDRDANGNLVVADDYGDERVWTGSTAEGTPFGDDCVAWTSDAFISEQGSYGDFEKINGEWLQSDDTYCEEKHHLYCAQKS